MLKIILLCFFLTILINGNAQNSNPIVFKPFIDTTALKFWPSLESMVSITNDGSYIMYIISNQPIGKHTFIIKSTINFWERKFILNEIPIGFFSADSRKAVFMKTDTLYFVSLGTNSLNYIVNVKLYKQPRFNKGIWLAYVLKNTAKELVVSNLSSGKDFRYTSIDDFQFDDFGNNLVLKVNTIHDSTSSQILQWLNLQDMKMQVVWPANGYGNKMRILHFRFDDNGTQLTFMTEEGVFRNSLRRNEEIERAIWYFKKGSEQSIKIMFDESYLMIDSNYVIDISPLEFSKNGKYIFFKVMKRLLDTNVNLNEALVDIWSYKDPILRSMQSQRPIVTKYASVINLENNSIFRLEKENEYANINNVKGDYVIIYNKREVSEFEPWMELKTQRSYFLLSLVDGTRRHFYTQGKQYKKYYFSFSPSGKNLIYFDSKKQRYFYYDFHTGISKDLSKNIPFSLSVENEYSSGSLLYRPKYPIGIAAWISNDSSILVYDNFDIWKINIFGNQSPVNITNGYGRSNNIKFRLLSKNESIDKNSDLLVTAFNIRNKHSGFYRVSFKKIGNPELLIIGPYKYELITSNAAHENSKLSNYDWRFYSIVTRESDTEFPNLYITSDYKEFKQLTDLQPHQPFKWLKAELISWRQLDGTVSQGILYKPQDFNPSKKYPLIFHYYEQMSNKLYAYLKADFSKGDMNIPWFVSRDYLVFTPDIHFTVGKVGASAFNTVISAAKYFSTKKWVDAKRMGLQGHSFGAFATNYLVTHCNLFAAAVSSQGVSNISSNYGSLRGLNGQGMSNHYYFESGQGQMGTTLWQQPYNYILNSPVFRCDKVVTPILLTANKNDESVPWSQGLEFFTGLRRLGKTAWMLQYDGEGHVLLKKKNQVDYTIRMTQFFDHFLKGKTPSKWMTSGIPPTMKGIDNGLMFDPHGFCSLYCPICIKMHLNNN